MLHLTINKHKLDSSSLTMREERRIYPTTTRLLTGMTKTDLASRFAQWSTEQASRNAQHKAPVAWECVCMAGHPSLMFWPIESLFIEKTLNGSKMCSATSWTYGRAHLFVPPVAAKVYKGYVLYIWYIASCRINAHNYVYYILLGLSLLYDTIMCTQEIIFLSVYRLEPGKMSN